MFNSIIGGTKGSDLEKKLLLFKNYFNQERVHQGLDGTPPDEHDCVGEGKVADLNNYRWEKLCRGLYQLPNAA